MIDWKAVAHHQRHLRKLSEQLEITLKRKLGAEHTKRVTLVNQLTELLPQIALPAGAAFCRACRAPLQQGHRRGCAYVAALEAVAEAGRSMEG